MKTRLYVMAVAILVVAAAVIGYDSTTLRAGDQAKDFGQEAGPSMVRVVPTFAAFDKGMLPIHAACRSGSADAVRMLLDRGADAGARTQNGWTPMHYAAFSGSVQVMRLLTAQHGSAKDLTNDGLSPLTIAAVNGNTDAMKYLVDQGAEVSK